MTERKWYNDPNVYDPPVGTYLGRSMIEAAQRYVVGYEREQQNLKFPKNFASPSESDTSDQHSSNTEDH